MNMPSAFRAALVALTAFAGALASAAHADTCNITLNITMGGFIFGGYGGRGELNCHGDRYRLSVRGFTGGAIFGVEHVMLRGTVYNINVPSDIAGSYFTQNLDYALVAGGGLWYFESKKGVKLWLDGLSLGLAYHAGFGRGGFKIKMK